MRFYKFFPISTKLINQKYQILNWVPIKNFALKEVCNLITNSMQYISIEEN